MEEQEYPHLGLYCPAKEAHPERRERLLVALSDDAIFVHCVEHDWLRIELSQFGKRLKFKGVTAIASQVKSKDGNKVIFSLQPIPIHARGKFQVKSRKWREGVK